MTEKQFKQVTVEDMKKYWHQSEANYDYLLYMNEKSDSDAGVWK